MLLLARILGGKVRPDVAEVLLPFVTSENPQKCKLWRRSLSSDLPHHHGMLVLVRILGGKVRPDLRLSAGLDFQVCVFQQTMTGRI